MNECKTQTKTNGGTTSADIQHNKSAIKKYLELFVLHANVWMFYVKQKFSATCTFFFKNLRASR